MLYWETAQETSLPEEHVEFAQIWKALPKVVFSTTLESVVGNTRLAKEGVGEEVARLKEQPGKDIAVGGAGLARACMKLGLIDEWRLFVSPVLLGGGTPYFPPLDEPLNLELVDKRTFGARVVYLRYRPVSNDL
jgi:dihydrofolate reductase